MHIDIRLDGDFVEEYDWNSTTVLRGEYRGRAVAMKMLRLCLTSDLDKCMKVNATPHVLPNLPLIQRPQRFFREAVAWRHLRHPNILPLLGMSLDPTGKKFAMVSEWMVHGNINEFVAMSEGVNRVQLVSEDLIPQDTYCNPSQLVDATSGLEYMHSFDMVHGDLKGVWFY